MTTMTLPTTTAFEVYVANDSFKFNAAHFVAFEGYRERLHGHNYRLAVRMLGRRQIGPDGYVIDFGAIKEACRRLCKRLNEHFLCPVYSNVLNITLIEKKRNDDDSTNPTSSLQETTLGHPAAEDLRQLDPAAGATLRIQCQDGSVFSLPYQDCYLLPIVHATAEELAIYCWGELLTELPASYLTQRGIHTLEVTVAEAPGQEAIFRHEIIIPSSSQEEEKAAAQVDGIPPEQLPSPTFPLDVRRFIMEGAVVPLPCLPTTTDKEKPSHKAGYCPKCSGQLLPEKAA